MKTVILAGGFGTRIRDVAENIPKPMIPVGRYPILWHIMKYYASFGHKDFILCLGYKSEVVKDFFLNYQMRTSDLTISLDHKREVEYHTSHAEDDWTVTLAETGLNAMTGARVFRVREYLEGENDFFLTYGDGLGSIDLKALAEFHKSHGKIMTVTGVRPPGRFGEVEVDKSGLVKCFNEKPQVSSGRISGGYFVCNKKIFDYLTDDESLTLETAPMSRLVEDGELMMFKHDDFWHPMDTYRDYKLLNSMWDGGSAPWKNWA